MSHVICMGESCDHISLQVIVMCMSRQSHVDLQAGGGMSELL